MISVLSFSTLKNAQLCNIVSTLYRLHLMMISTNKSVLKIVKAKQNETK